MTTSNLDEEDVSLVEKFQTAKLGPPQPAKLPEGWNILSELEKLPENATYLVESLQGGVTIGMGWRKIDETFTSALLARARAFDLASNLGNPARVLIAMRKGLLPVVIFYKKDGKNYVSMKVNDEVTIEQEVITGFDRAGGMMKVTYEKGQLTVEKKA